MNLPYTPATLEALMSDLESGHVERKESIKRDSPTRICQAVCAFANGLSKHRRPGLVFAGVCRKPIFDLTVADGAIGSHAVAASDAFNDFREITQEILRRIRGG